MTVETFLTAFLGAAFAFLFFLAGEVFSRAYERSRAHYNAIVRLEALLNELLDVIAVQVAQIGPYRATVENAKVIFDLPRPLPFDGSIQGDLYDVGLVNKVLSIAVSVRRANNDIENVRSFYPQLVARYIEGEMSPESYKKNALHIVDGCEKLAKALQAYTEEVKDLLAIVRVYVAREAPVGHRIVRGAIKAIFVRSVVVTEEEKGRERKALEAEIEKVRSDSKARLTGGSSG